MIKFLQKIILYALLTTFIYSQNEIDLNLSIVNSGKYSLSSFIDPDVNLWQVIVSAPNYNVDEAMDLRLEIDMKKDGITVIWGVSEFPKDFKINGWLVFEIPKGAPLREFRWEQVDILSVSVLEK